MIPQLAALLPVEDVLQSLASPDRRLTLHRIFFDLYAPSFPAQARIPVAVALCGGAGHFGLCVRLLDMAGREVARDEDRFTASAVHVHLLTLRGTLNAPGEYRLEASLEGVVVASLPLIVASSAPPVQNETDGLAR
ncbi:hypothetical protein FJY94_05930 [Candidatus Kaiserbacteria bacterium]|nr:hypothetical protein [Candidatus Kaiserbacteria bacterium]